MASLPFLPAFSYTGFSRKYLVAKQTRPGEMHAKVDLKVGFTDLTFVVVGKVQVQTVGNELVRFSQISVHAGLERDALFFREVQKSAQPIKVIYNFDIAGTAERQMACVRALQDHAKDMVSGDGVTAALATMASTFPQMDISMTQGQKQLLQSWRELEESLVD